MLEELKERLRDHEGVIPHMYLDTLGYVTAAVGHLLADVEAAKKLPFLRGVSGLDGAAGTPATPEEIEFEFNAVKAMKPAMLPEFYRARTMLRLPADAIDILLDQDVAGFAGTMEKLLPGFGAFPETAQEALLDMAFQLGAGGLMQKFPHLILAVKARDWNACAVNCHRTGIQEWRNTATAGLFKRSAKVTNNATKA